MGVDYIVLGSATGVPGHAVKERALGEGKLGSQWGELRLPQSYGQHLREAVQRQEIWSIECSTSLELEGWDGQRISILREQDARIDAPYQMEFDVAPSPLALAGQPWLTRRLAGNWKLVADIRS